MQKMSQDQPAFDPNALLFSGIGVHSGESAQMRLVPAPDGQGITFVRTDLGPEFRVAASLSQTLDSSLCTKITRKFSGMSAEVSTIEHLMSALRACQIFDCDIELGGAEVPIMDGSAKIFFDALQEALIPRTSKPRGLEVLKPVRVEAEGAFAELLPYSGQLFSVGIDYPGTLIGRQSIEFELSSRVFAEEIAFARTFGFLHDAPWLRAEGKALGASLENSIVVGEDLQTVLNPGGLRDEREFVRHKALDAIGDLALVGHPIVGHFRAEKSGHRLNVLLARKLMASTDHWRFI